jgi:oligopeptide/dipeptide ABC transporter ATP-binding protein
VQAQVLEALQAAKSETGAALILITHDLGVIAGYADRVTVMYAGRAVESGTVEDIFYRPRMPYTLGLLGSLPRMDAERAGRLTPILGTPPSLLHLPSGCPFAPRCPAARDHCTASEPDLVGVDAAGDHRSACHFHEELVGVSSDQLFAATSKDDVLPDVPLGPDGLPIDLTTGGLA